MSDSEEEIQVVVSTVDEQTDEEQEEEQVMSAEEANDDYLALVDNVFNTSPTPTETATASTTSAQSDEKFAREMQKEELRQAKARAKSGSTTSPQSTATSRSGRAPSTTSAHSKSSASNSSTLPASGSVSGLVSSGSDVATSRSGRAPSTTSANSKSSASNSSTLPISGSVSGSVLSVSDEASTSTAQSDEKMAREMQKEELRRAKSRAKASSKSGQSKASSNSGQSNDSGSSSSSVVPKQKERKERRNRNNRPRDRTGTDASNMTARSRNIEVAVTTTGSSSSSSSSGNSSGERSGRSGRSGTSSSHGSSRSPSRNNKPRPHQQQQEQQEQQQEQQQQQQQQRRERQRGESNHAQQLQKSPPSEFKSSGSSINYPSAAEQPQQQPSNSATSTEEADAAFARALQEEEAREASAASRPPTRKAAFMMGSGKPVPSSSEDVALARALQNQEIQTSRQQHAQQREIIRDHLRVRTTVGEGTRWERALKYVNKKVTRAKDGVTDAVGAPGTCLRNLTMLFTPVRLRTDSETARDMDARFNEQNAGSYSGMSAADRRLAERQQRQQIQRDEEIAMQIHGREVQHVENDMLHHQYGDRVNGNLDFMRSTEHYPYFCRGMSLFLTLMLVVEIIYNGGFESLSTNAALGPSVDTMVALGAKKKDLILEGEVYRLVTPMFLHAGVLHLLFNLLGLNNIGAPAEREYGSKKIAIIYFSAGLFAVTVSAIFIPNVVSVGASGAIFALFGACWSDLIQNWTLYRGNACKVLIQLSFMTILNMVIGLVPFIDNFQHLGGMFAGFFLGLALLVHPRYSISGRQKSAKDYQVALRYFSMIFVPVIIAVALVVLFTVPNALTDCPACAYLSCIPLPPGVPKDELWWDCDPCSVGGIAQSQLFRNGTLSVTCPAGTFNEEDVAAADAVVRTLRVCQQFCQD